MASTSTTTTPRAAFAAALLMAAAWWWTLADRGRDGLAQPGDPPATSAKTFDASTAQQPVWLVGGWTRLTPPPGWRREDVPAAAPGDPVYELRFVKPDDQGGTTPSATGATVVQWRVASASAGETTLESLPERRRAGYNWTGTMDLPLLGTRWFTADGSNQADRLPRVLRLHEVTPGVRIVVVADGAVRALEEWFNAANVQIVTPVAGCEGMVGLSGHDRAVPLPAGFVLAPTDRPPLSGAISAVRRDAAGDDDGDAGDGDNPPAGRVTQFVAAVVYGPGHDDLDAAFGPVERTFDRRRMQRTNGRGLTVRVAGNGDATPTIGLDALITEGTIDGAAAGRAFVAGYMHDPRLHLLLVAMFVCDPNDVPAWRQVLLERVLPHLWWPAPTPPDGVTGAELSGEYLASADGQQKVAQLNLVLLGAPGKPVMFDGKRWSVIWSLTRDGNALLSRGPLECYSSGDCLATGRHGTAMQLSLAVASQAGAMVKLQVTIEGRAPIILSARLEDLFSQ
ncbi:MAG: hypothetical protein AB7K09_04675 [Planctomycetota bacterium]